MRLPASWEETLKRYGQQHLTRFWDELSTSERRSLVTQLEAVDFPLMERLMRERPAPGQTSVDQAARERAVQAQPPQQLLRIARSDAERAAWRAAAARGEELLRQGRVGAILVAGGQGARLGFDKPKGMFPIGPVSQKTLFAMHCEQILARGRRAGRPIPYFIMTSDATHADTVADFEEHACFGLDRQDVFFFQQGTLPAVADAAPRILLAEKGRISTSPDGHGGMLKALARGGLPDVMRERGLEYLYYHQVDNPTAIVCDPVLLGMHVEHGSDMTTKVVAKESAAEKMGVVVSLDGRTEIIEYSDLPPERAEATAADGGLLLWAGNTAIHVFNRTFLELLRQDACRLPYHVAHKPAPHLDEAGRLVTPHGSNAHKFEQFIFDALPFARSALVVEADRAREFNPVKNAAGKDSPETSRAALLRIARENLLAAGAQVGDVPVEISPLFALDIEELCAKLKPGATFDAPAVLQ